jgi:hypothetical protein
MKFNIVALKNGMAKVGFVVSAGEAWTARDISNFLDYAHRFHGLSRDRASYGLAYPSTVPKTLPGHPDFDEDTADELMAPVVFPVQVEPIPTDMDNSQTDELPNVYTPPVEVPSESVAEPVEAPVEDDATEHTDAE